MANMRTITVTTPWEAATATAALESAMSETTCTTFLTTKCPPKTIPTILADSVSAYVNKFADSSGQSAKALPTITSSHAAVTSLTDALLKRTSLPTTLATWKPVLDHLKCVPMPVYVAAGVGASVGVGIGAVYTFKYLKGYYSRQRIRMVVSFIRHKVRTNPELYNMLSDPDRLFAILEMDIQAFEAKYFSKAEGNIVRETIKRSLWVEEEVDEDEDEEARPSKRKKTDGEDDEDAEPQTKEDDGAEEEQEEDLDVTMEDALSQSPSPKPKLEVSDNTESQSQNATKGVQKPIFGAYYPSIKSTQEPAEPQLDNRASLDRGQTPRSDGSYGFDYEDFESSSESSNDSSPCAPRGQQQQPQHRPKAVKPQNPFGIRPPTALARASGNKISGTNLSPISEGSSDVDRLDETKTQYRVGGSRGFYSTTKSAEVARSQRQAAKRSSSLPPISSPLSVETSREHSARTQSPHPKRVRRSLSVETPTRRSKRTSAYKGEWQR